EHHGRSFEDEGTTEEEAREQYRKIAERRVRLGLVVAEIGNVNQINVTEEEHQQALIGEVRRFPGQEQRVYDYYRQNPQALASLRAPVFENKVVDFIAGKATQTAQAMHREEVGKVSQSDELDEGHDHAHHRHEHCDRGNMMRGTSGNGRPFLSALVVGRLATGAGAAMRRVRSNLGY